MGFFGETHVHDVPGGYGQVIGWYEIDKFPEVEKSYNDGCHPKPVWHCNCGWNFIVIFTPNRGYEWVEYIGEVDNEPF